MSRYNLRSVSARINPSHADSRRRANSESSPLAPVFPPRLGPSSPRVGEGLADASRSYSEVVAARTPTPPTSVAGRDEDPVEPVALASLSVDQNDTMSSERTRTIPGGFHDSPGSENDPDKWSVVRRRRKRSAVTDTSDNEQNESSENSTVQKAKRSLSANDLRRVAQRGKAEAKARVATSDSTPSSGSDIADKGKSVDPRNWGQLRTDSAELNVQNQQNELEHWERQKEVPGSANPNSSDSMTSSSDEDFIEKKRNKKLRSKKKRANPVTRESMVFSGRQPLEASTPNPIETVISKVLKSKGKKPRTSTVRVIEPSQQIAPQSYLGKALDQIRTPVRSSRKRHQRDEPSDPSDSSESSSDSEESSTSSDSERSSSGSSDSSGSLSSSTRSSSHRSKKPRKRHGSGHKKKARKSKTKSSGYGNLKLIPPNKYSGAADSRAFHRFMTEGTAYVSSGKVKRRDQVFVLSHYITDKAHEFYVREVAGDPYFKFP